jgi:hypothetical protein
MLRLPVRPLAVALALAAPAACSGAGATVKGGAGKESRDPARGSHSLVVERGTVIDLRSHQEITSRRNHAGDGIVATATSAALDAARDTVIPAGAEFLGTIQEIAPAPNPRATGRLQIAFGEVRFNGVVHPISVRVAGMGTQLKGRGVTGGTVAKVGAGAAVGGIVGRLIGGNTTGALVGAAAGGAAGGVYAHETRSLDVVLPAGSRIRVSLTGPFAAGVAAAH